MKLKLFLSVVSLLAILLWVSCTTSVNNNGGSTSDSPIVITSIAKVATIVTGDAAVVACRGNYAYLYGWNCVTNSNFVIYDMSTPSSPVRRGSLTNGGYGYGIALNGNYAYLQTDGNGANMFVNGGNVIVDISDVDHPKEVQQTTDGYSSDYQNYFHNGYLYTFSYNLVGVFNMSNPSNFNWVTNITSGVNCYEWGAFSGNYLYVLNNNMFQVYDISSPASFSLVSSITCTNTSSGGCAVKGNYAYVMGDLTNVVVVNIANPASPVVVTNYTITNNELKCREFNEAKILGNYLMMTGDSNFVVLNIEDPTNISYVSSVPLDNNSGWGFDILNDQYAIVADDKCYYVIKLY